MKTNRFIRTGILPLGVIVLSMFFNVGRNLHAQDKGKKQGQPDVRIDVKREFDKNGNISRYDSSYSFSWSYDGSTDMDSLLESLRNNFGISPFGEGDVFNMPHGNHPFLHAFPGKDTIFPDKEYDSLYQFIDPQDSIYSLKYPHHFFYGPGFSDPFNDSIFNRFFNDPMSGHDPFQWQDFDFFRFLPSDSAFNFNHSFDMRSMLENHRRMMEELHQFFEFDLPRYPMPHDSIPLNPSQQRYHRHSRSIPKSQEI
jgi:hypothetical protein